MAQGSQLLLELEEGLGGVLFSQPMPEGLSLGGWVGVGVRVVHGACVALAPRSSLRLECVSEVEASVDGHSAQRLIRVRGYGLRVRGEG